MASFEQYASVCLARDNLALKLSEAETGGRALSDELQNKVRQPF